MRHIFIVNPVSGKKNAGRMLLPSIESAAASCGIPIQIEWTKAPRHATQLARQHAEQGQPVRLYAVGGDGTLNEVFTGARGFPNAQVAAIPCGSGNDFIRAWGDDHAFLDIPGQLHGMAVPIDLIKVDGGISAAITSTGLDANVAYNIPRYRRVPLISGSMAYNISILEQLIKPLGAELRIDIDGAVMEGSYLIATVCNGRYYGGGYCAAPMACLNDGVLEVILVKKISRLLIASIIGKYKKGEHYRDGRIIREFENVMQHFQAKKVEITPLRKPSFVLNIDGECGPAPRLFAEVLPLAVNFVVPAPLVGANGSLLCK